MIFFLLFFFFFFIENRIWHFMHIVLETIFMKCQNLFSGGGTKKNISVCYLLKISSSMLSINMFADGKGPDQTAHSFRVIRTLGFLRQNIYQWPQDVKEAAYRRLVHSILEYGSYVWDPQGVVLQQQIKKVQIRAATFVTSYYCWLTWILENLKCESLKKRGRDSRLILLYKCLNGAASIPTNDLIPPI